MRSSKHVVLGKDVMEAVWDDMKHTKLPTWIHPAPPNWGMVEWGKLSADQWRLVSTVHLPITRIRLWGHIVLDCNLSHDSHWLHAMFASCLSSGC